jgi:hypothetical protein
MRRADLEAMVASLALRIAELERDRRRPPIVKVGGAGVPER